VQNKPYFCPNCRSNRIKFREVTKYSRWFLKDAITGEIVEQREPEPVAEPEPTIECMVCHFTGNEMRFIKQAEKEPRTGAPIHPAYT